MKLGLIGANGNVGTELCFLLKNDVDLKPIIRNRLGAVFLKHHSFPCIIADISQNKDSKECLADIDAVVISSYATDPFSGSQTQSSQKINEQIIKNSVKFSAEDATIIYFSTIRAFSHKIDPNTSRFGLCLDMIKKKGIWNVCLCQNAEKTRKEVLHYV